MHFVGGREPNENPPDRFSLCTRRGVISTGRVWSPFSPCILIPRFLFGNPLSPGCDRFTTSLILRNCFPHLTVTARVSVVVLFFSFFFSPPFPFFFFRFPSRFMSHKVRGHLSIWSRARSGECLSLCCCVGWPRTPARDVWHLLRLFATRVYWNSLFFRFFYWFGLRCRDQKMPRDLCCWDLCCRDSVFSVFLFALSNLCLFSPI